MIAEKEDKISKKIKYNIILENILDESNVNLNYVERSTQLLISNLDDRYVDYKISFNYVDVDVDVRNKIYTSISAIGIGEFSGVENSAIACIGQASINNLRNTFYFDKNLKDYIVNGVDFEIIEIVEKVKKIASVA